ncbi:hypothetical protein I79_017009 [Cricetulus griseus]|uniref:Uncharacterized protein n=1 Tax=Cricetulus griseus TaxID=10029 RepID=G3I0W7_CRIGR|nr:hypothetical protein I79_017009 [Cricetulus griseus]
MLLLPPRLQLCTTPRSVLLELLRLALLGSGGGLLQVADFLLNPQEEGRVPGSCEGPHLPTRTPVPLRRTSRSNYLPKASLSTVTLEAGRGNTSPAHRCVLLFSRVPLRLTAVKVE